MIIDSSVNIFWGAVLIFLYIAVPITILFLLMRIFAKMVAKQVVIQMRAELQKGKGKEVEAGQG